MQPSEVNYNCRLRNEPTTSSHKNENDLSLLVACKLQLSSEVIKWKTESLRLQKEKDAAQSLNKELDKTITDLKSKLLKEEEENRRLKMKKLLINDEKLKNIERLEQTLNKCHSFPMIDNSAASNINHLRTSEFSNFSRDDVQQEDWKEVSARMLMQMQQEMEELQTMRSSISTCVNTSGFEDTQSDSDYADDLENGLSALLSNTKSLKQQLLDQRRKLSYLMKSIHEGVDSKNETSFAKKKSHDPLPSGLLKSPSELSRSRIFHDNLNEQLKALQMVEISGSKKEQDMGLQPCNSSTKQGVISAKPCTDEKLELTVTVEDRICPICQLHFDFKVPQLEFEEHVCNHLETDSVSLINQYVVL